ncbi:MAG TPA: hypothetical protein VKB68_04280 [Stellaceae bacterium]|nr:hypothetical protein [Stellaceae bacterium]
MEWQRHLQERAARYADIARTAPDPRRRVQAKVTAREYEAALTACNTTEDNPDCCFAPDHWMRKGCRRAQTGSCAIVATPEPKAEPQEPSSNAA